MPLKNFVSLFIAAISLSACGSSRSGSLQSLSVGASCVDGSNPRIKTCNESLGLIQNDSVQSAQALSLGLPTLTLVATVTPPSSGATLLQASDVFMNGGYAFIGYNTSGSTVAGGIDVLNTAILNLPLLTSSLIFPDTKINSLYRNGSTVYAAGANNGNGAVLNNLTVSAGVLSGSFTQSLLTGYAGVGVFGSGANVYVTTGDNAGIYNYSASSLSTAGTPSATASYAINDARGSVLADGNLWVVSGQPGKVTQVTPAGALVSSIALGGASIAQSKSTIKAGTQTILVTSGEGGAKIICRADGVTMASIPAAVVSGVSSSLTVTNAAAAGPGVLFLANGVAGAYAYAMTNALTSPSSNCAGINISYLGSINFGSTLSVNNIYYNNTALFIASGLGGFKVVTLLNLAILNPYLDYQ